MTPHNGLTARSLMLQLQASRAEVEFLRGLLAIGPEIEKASEAVRESAAALNAKYGISPEAGDNADEVTGEITRKAKDG